MRVLISDVSAPLGQALLEKLSRQAGIQRILAVSPPGDEPWGRHPAVVGWRADLAHPRVVHDLVSLAASLGIDTVINTRPRDLPFASQLLTWAERTPGMRRFVHLSSARVYQAQPSVIDETAAIDWHSDPALVRCDLGVASRIGTSSLELVVLRLAEVLAPRAGSQLWDYLGTRTCLRPMGYDPMLNLLSADDAVEAVVKAASAAAASGVFNVAGADTLPLSQVIKLWEAHEIPLPSALLRPLYALRGLVRGTRFDYRLNHAQLHFGGVLDDRRARTLLGHAASHPIRWPARVAPEPT